MALDDGEVVQGLRVGDVAAQQFRVAADDAEGVVDFVGEPSGELAHGHELFGLAHLFAHAPLGGVLAGVDHHAAGGAGGGVQRVAGDGEGAAVGEGDRGDGALAL